MSAQVKLYTFLGLVPAPMSGGNTLHYDSVMMFKNPYLGGEVITSADTSTAASSSAATAPTGTAIAMLQVQPGKRVGYEVTPAGFTERVATSSSPTVTGDQTIHFGPGWTISVIELA